MPKSPFAVKRCHKGKLNCRCSTHANSASISSFKDGDFEVEEVFVACASFKAPDWISAEDSVLLLNKLGTFGGPDPTPRCQCNQENGSSPSSTSTLPAPENKQPERASTAPRSRSANRQPEVKVPAQPEPPPGLEKRPPDVKSTATSAPASTQTQKADGKPSSNSAVTSESAGAKSAATPVCPPEKKEDVPKSSKPASQSGPSEAKATKSSSKAKTKPAPPPKNATFEQQTKFLEEKAKLLGFQDFSIELCSDMPQDRLSALLHGDFKKAAKLKKKQKESESLIYKEQEKMVAISNRMQFFDLTQIMLSLRGLCKRVEKDPRWKGVKASTDKCGISRLWQDLCLNEELVVTAVKNWFAQYGDVRPSVSAVVGPGLSITRWPCDKTKKPENFENCSAHVVESHKDGNLHLELYHDNDVHHLKPIECVPFTVILSLTLMSRDSDGDKYVRVVTDPYHEYHFRGNGELLMKLFKHIKLGIVELDTQFDEMCGLRNIVEKVLEQEQKKKAEVEESKLAEKKAKEKQKQTKEKSLSKNIKEKEVKEKEVNKKEIKESVQVPASVSTSNEEPHVSSDQFVEPIPEKPDPVKCGVCVNDVQPTEEIYFRLECVDKCDLFLHKTCLHDAMMKQGFKKKREYKDAGCPTEGCSAHVQAIHERDMANVETLFIRCVEKSALEKKPSPPPKKEKKKPEKKEAKKKHHHQQQPEAGDDAEDREETPDEPEPPKVEAEEKENLRPIIHLPISEVNVVPMQRVLDEVEEKYGTEPGYQQAQKPTRSKKKKNNLLDIEFDSHRRREREFEAMLKEQFMEPEISSSPADKGLGLELEDYVPENWDESFDADIVVPELEPEPPMIEDESAFPAPGTSEESIEMAKIVSNVEPVLGDLVMNTPQYQKSANLSIQGLKEALLTVASHLLTPKQIAIIERMFDTNDAQVIQPFVFKLKYFVVGRTSRGQVTYCKNRLGQQLEQKEVARRAKPTVTEDPVTDQVVIPPPGLLPNSNSSSSLTTVEEPQTSRQSQSQPKPQLPQPSPLIKPSVFANLYEKSDPKEPKSQPPSLLSKTIPPPQSFEPTLNRLNPKQPSGPISFRQFLEQKLPLRSGQEAEPVHVPGLRQSSDVLLPQEDELQPSRHGFRLMRRGAAEISVPSPFPNENSVAKSSTAEKMEKSAGSKTDTSSSSSNKNVAKLDKNPSLSSQSSVDEPNDDAELQKMLKRQDLARVQNQLREELLREQNSDVMDAIGVYEPYQQWSSPNLPNLEEHNPLQGFYPEERAAFEANSRPMSSTSNRIRMISPNFDSWSDQQSSFSSMMNQPRNVSTVSLKEYQKLVEESVTAKFEKKLVEEKLNEKIESLQAEIIALKVERSQNLELRERIEELKQENVTLCELKEREASNVSKARNFADQVRLRLLLVECESHLEVVASSIAHNEIIQERLREVNEADSLQEMVEDFAENLARWHNIQNILRHRKALILSGEYSDLPPVPPAPTLPLSALDFFQSGQSYSSYPFQEKVDKYLPILSREIEEHCRRSDKTKPSKTTLVNKLVAEIQSQPRDFDIRRAVKNIAYDLGVYYDVEREKTSTPKKNGRSWDVVREQFTRELKEDRECYVCLEVLPLSDISSSDVLQCPHLACREPYHQECVRQWLVENPTCPSCKRSWPDPVDFPGLK